MTDLFFFSSSGGFLRLYVNNIRDQIRLQVDLDDIDFDIKLSDDVSCDSKAKWLVKLQSIFGQGENIPRSGAV